MEEEVLSIQQEIEVQEQQIENIEKFVQKAHKYVHIEELTPYALRELVSSIYVDAPDKSSVLLSARETPTTGIKPIRHSPNAVKLRG